MNEPNVAPGPEPTADEVRVFVARFPSPVDAVLSVARAAQVGVAYEYRETIDPDGLLSDQQWAQVAAFLEDMDEFFTDDDLVSEYRDLAFSKGHATCSNGRPLIRLQGCDCTTHTSADPAPAAPGESASQQWCAVCHEPIRQGQRPVDWLHVATGNASCWTGDGAVAYPPPNDRSEADNA